MLNEVMTTGGETPPVDWMCGDPLERDGITALPATTVAGGGGQDAEGPDGHGGSFRLAVRPTGVAIVTALTRARLERLRGT